ncbi:LysE family translocator [Dankookia rubra]|uniref:LysE family translocator n=1 Tax=Dankookia rubra TaxID=1442381 RepID=A0A4R5QDP9_9PROT|nr:LysE family transporter [Dankookia rubra]TDH60769.1 LysE family translocator [Dankookia rubra]
MGLPQPDVLSLVAFAGIATVTPGGANLLAASSGARFGLMRSLPLLLGFSLGLAALVGAAGIGFGALLEAAPILRLVMRSAGSAYVLWLAWRIASAGRPEPPGWDGTAPPGFLAAVVLLWLNPKAWTTAVAASATYAGLVPGLVPLAGLLALVFGVAAAVSLHLWCAFGMLLARTLRTEAQWRAANILLGSALVASLVPMWS